MTSLHKSSSIHVFSLMSVAIALTTMLGVAVGQCGPGMTNACRYGAGNPCPTSSQCVSNLINSYCNTYTESPALGAYYKDTGLVVGDWYRCTQVTGSFASQGACAEGLKLCSSTNIYQDGLCTVTCTYTGNNWGCQAGSASPICTYVP